MTHLRGDLAGLVVAAAAGRPIAEIADAAGTSVSTAQRRLRDPQVRQAVSDMRVAALERTADRLSELCGRALDKLREWLEDESATIRLRTAELILNAAMRYHAADQEQRVLAIEAAIHQATIRTSTLPAWDGGDVRARRQSWCLARIYGSRASAPTRSSSDAAFASVKGCARSSE